MLKKLLYILIILCTICINVSAFNITYPDEYYSTKLLADDHSSIGFSAEARTASYTLNIFYEFRRHTILMEKQNELIAESNRIKWIQTCYDPTQSSYMNFTGLRIECYNAGYPVERWLL